jgi:hypothetical protein
VTFDEGRDDAGVDVETKAAVDGAWDDLLGYLLDLNGKLVSVSADAIVVEKMRIQGTELMIRAGKRWAAVELGDDGRTRAKVLFCEQGLLESGWIEDESQPERHVFAVLDRGREREVLIMLERE